MYYKVKEAQEEAAVKALKEAGIEFEQSYMTLEFFMKAEVEYMKDILEEELMDSADFFDDSVSEEEIMELFEEAFQIVYKSPDTLTMSDIEVGDLHDEIKDKILEVMREIFHNRQVK